MKFANLTKHVINDVESGINIPPSGGVARVEAKYEKAAESSGVSFYKVTYGEVIGLPEELEFDCIYIVSGMVLEAIKTKMPGVQGAFVAPGELVTNDEGEPIGCCGFKLP